MLQVSPTTYTHSFWTGEAASQPYALLETNADAL